MLKKRFLSLTLVALFLVSMVVSVVAVDPADALYISDMTWISATCNPFFTGGVRRDTDIKGDSLNIAGVTYAKGFGSAARDAATGDAELKVTIPQGYNYFEAIVGFDDRTLQKGSAEFKVLVNGVVVATTGIVLGNSGPHTISADVTPGSTLSLVTTDGGDGAANDTVDWCNAALYTVAEPEVAITSPTGNVGSSNVTVNGTWSNVDAVKIFAGGVEKGEATLSQNGTWTYALQLASTGQILIEAKGIVGGVVVTSAQVTVTYVDVLYISDMQWISATCNSFFTGGVRRDTDIKGDSLNIAGVTYAKGFGSAACDTGKPDAEVKVTIPQGYNYFEAIVGFDDRTNGSGTAEFKVLVDGVLLATTGKISGGSGPHTISADVTPGSTLSLVTTNGGDGAASDTVDWCDAALYKTAKAQLAITSPKGNVASKNIQVKGTWKSLDSIKIYMDGTESGSAELLDDGTWTYSLTLINDNSTLIEAKGFSEGIIVCSNETTVTCADLVYISDMNWITATSHSSFTPQRDTSVTKKPIILDGVTYAKGIGTHAPDIGSGDADIVITVPDGYTFFESYVGLDYTATTQANDIANGSVQFLLLQDDVVILSTDVIRSNGIGALFRCDVRPGSKLTLRVTNAGDTASCDVADWGGAALYAVNPQKGISVKSSQFLINDIAVDQSSYIIENDEISYEANISNQSGSDMDAVLFIAAYSGNKLLGVHVNDILVPNDLMNTTTCISEKYKISEHPDNIEVFIWDGLDHLAPIYNEKMEENIFNNNVVNTTPMYETGTLSDTAQIGTGEEFAVLFSATEKFNRLELKLSGTGSAYISLYPWNDSIMKTTYQDSVITKHYEINGEENIELYAKTQEAGSYLLVVNADSGSLSSPKYSVGDDGTVLYINGVKQTGAIETSVRYAEVPTTSFGELPDVYTEINSDKTTAAEKLRARAEFDGYMNNLSTLPISFYIGDVKYNGLNSEFTEVSRTVTTEGAKEKVVITLNHTSGLQITMDTALYEEYGAYEWTVYIANPTASNSPVIKELYGTDINYAGEKPQIIGIYGDATYEGPGNTDKGTPYNNYEIYEPYNIDLSAVQTKSFKAHNGRPSEKDFPYYNFEYGDQGVLMAVGWEGQWQTNFAYSNNSTNFTAKQQYFNSYLKPGESIRTPLAAFVIYDGRGEERATNLWRNWFIDCNMHRDSSGNLPKPQVNGGANTPSRLMFYASDQEQIDTLKLYYDNGVDLDFWWMDASWYFVDFNQKQMSSMLDYVYSGVWEVDTVKFPSKFKAISDYANAHNTKTMLWFEMERVGIDNSLFKTDGSTLNPNWILQSQLVDMGIPDAVDWMYNRIKSIMETGGITHYLEDFNIEPLSTWRSNDDGDTRIGITENKYVQGHLELWDRLLEWNPDMIINVCSSGGRRNDLESVRRGLPFHISDYHFLENRDYQQGMEHSMFKWLPYFMACEDMDSNNKTVSEYSLYSALSMDTQLEFAIDIANLDWDMVKNFIALKKEIGGAFYGNYYPLTDWSIDSSTWMGREFLKDGEGFFQLFRHSNAAESEMTIKLRGLDNNKMYELTDIKGRCSGTYSGSLLTKIGVKVELPEKESFTVVKIKAIE